MRPNPPLPPERGPAILPPTPAPESNKPQARTNGRAREGKLVLEGVAPRRPLWQRALKALGFVALVGITVVAAVGAGLYYHGSDGLPDIPRVDVYCPPVATEIYTDDAVLAGEF